MTKSSMVWVALLQWLMDTKQYGVANQMDAVCFLIGYNGRVDADDLEDIRALVRDGALRP